MKIFISSNDHLFLQKICMQQSKIQEKILRETMAKHPSDITVKDMLKISKKLTRTESCKDGRTKWIERDLICDDQIKDILIWKCFHSLLVDKRCGRPRKFYLCKTCIIVLLIYTCNIECVHCMIYNAVLI